MADKSLRAFYNDSQMRENVYNYLIEFLEQTTIKKAFDKESTTGLGEAKEVIDEAFENLEVLFEKKVAKKEVLNEAR